MDYIDLYGNVNHLSNILSNSKKLKNNFNLINNDNIVTILDFSNNINELIIENNSNLKSILKFPTKLKKLTIINNTLLEDIYIPNVSISIEIINNPKIVNLEELLEEYKKTSFYLATFTDIKTEDYEIDIDDDFMDDEFIDDINLNIDDWIFRTNVDKYKKSPPVLHNNNPFLVNYIQYKGFSYPIITIPKGTILYNYSKGRYLNLKDKFNNIFNLENNISYENQLKFFYPLPYTANFGIDANYDICNIVVTNDDIQILCLVSPSPVSNETLRLQNKNKVINPNFENINYYDNNLTGKCEVFDHDLCINLNMMKNTNIQGYICISKIDSISNGETWYKNLNNTDAIEYIKDYLYKSCLSSVYVKNNNISHINSKLNLELPESLKNRIFSIPEIVLVPINTKYFFETEIHDDIFNSFNNSINDDFSNEESKIINIFKTYFNYSVINIPNLINLNDYLSNISSNIYMNKQCQNLQLYYPFAKKSEVLTEFVDSLSFVNVDYISSYSNINNSFCAFETVGYYLLNKKNKNTFSKKYGGKKNRIKKTIKNYRNMKNSKSHNYNKKTIIDSVVPNKKIVFERTKTGIPIVYAIDSENL